MSNESQFHPVDVVVLQHLRSGVDYPTCIAVRRDVDTAVVEQRCERLAERDLVEPVSPEVVYRITETGLRTLEARATGETESQPGLQRADSQ